MKAIVTGFPWTYYSKKLCSKIDKIQSCGFFDAKDAEERNMQLVDVSIGDATECNLLRLFWLVDKEDGSIVDARFQAFSHTAIIGAAQIACELVISKNYDQARRITVDIIDNALRDRPDTPAFPKNTIPYVHYVLEAVEKAAEQCVGLPLPKAYVAIPAPAIEGTQEGGIPEWFTFSTPQQISIVEEVLDRDIRPYIALDGGGVTVINLIEGKEVVIGYQGSCTSCYSSVGTTLSYIQQVLRAKVYPELKVTPQ